MQTEISMDVFTSPAVSDPTKQPSTDRTHQKSGGKYACRLQQLGGGISGWKEDVREIERAE